MRAEEKTMAKFGLFKMTVSAPLTKYEGDFMQMEKEFVQIRRYGTVDDPAGELLAAIRLEKGFDVRKIED